MLTRPSSTEPCGDAARPAALRIDISCPDAATVVVTPVGEADLRTVRDLRQALHRVPGAGRSDVVVDLDQLAFMDATLLGVLVDARLRLSTTGSTLKVRCRNHHGRRVLSITELDGLLDDRA